MPDPARYDRLLSPLARRALLDVLPTAAAFAAREFVDGPLRDAPRRVGAPLRAPFEGLWRAGRGEYRVRYETDEAPRVVRVEDVDHRGDAHRF